MAIDTLFVASQYQMQDNLEAALNTLEHVNVTGLSLEVSQDVFGRWCDTCSGELWSPGLSSDSPRYCATIRLGCLSRWVQRRVRQR
jgi:hypothetical protein